MRLAKGSSTATSLLTKVMVPMLSTSPSSFGYPSEKAQANYYLGDRITRDDLTLVSKVMEAHNIEPENTRVLKRKGQGPKHSFDVLQASAVSGCLGQWDDVDGHGTVVRLVGGDHHDEMSKICGSLLAAKAYAGNGKQLEIIDHYVASFLTGNLNAFRESQKVWVTDKSPSVETIFGFVEPYRDPHGVRSE